MKKANGSDILLEVLYDGIRSWYISQENHVDYDCGGGIMDYKLQHKSYGSHCLDSVILVEKNFSFSNVFVLVPLNTLIYVCIFQQSTTCKTAKFPPIRLNHSGPSDDLKTSKILPYNFSRYNFGKLLIQTLR